MLPCLGGIAGFLYRTTTTPLFHPNFECFPGLVADVVASKSEDPKLIIRVINVELTQHIRHGETDGQTDGRTTYDRNTALCATCIAR